MAAWSLLQKGRCERERRTVRAMIALYCRLQHRRTGRCPDCEELLQYAEERLRRCPFQDAKPTCADCTVHCYRTAPEMQDRIRRVMRYAGPRMVIFHPLLAVLHQLDRLSLRRTAGEKSRLRSCL